MHDVEEGRSTIEHKLGNDKSDECADLGVAMAGTQRAFSWLAKRQKKYEELVNGIQSLIIAILKEEKGEIAEK